MALRHEKSMLGLGTLLEKIGVVLFVVGLFVWYVGGSRSIFRLLTTRPLLQLSLLLVVTSLVIAFALDRRRPKDILGAAGVLAAGSVLFTWSAGALLNVVLDHSEVALMPSQIIRFHQPSKGPRQITVVWRKERVSLDADHAEGCAENQPATLHVHTGLLGLPWVSEVTCPASDIQPPSPG